MELELQLQEHIRHSDEIHERVITSLDYLINELIGVARFDIDGQTVREGGRMDQMEARIDTLESKVPVAKILTIAGAMATAVSSIVVTLFA